MAEQIPPETVQTGLSDLVAEVKDVEAKLEAQLPSFLVKTPATAAPAPALPPTPPAEPVAPPPLPTQPPPPVVVPPQAPVLPLVMVPSDEPIPAPADVVPVPTAAPASSPAIVSPELARLAQLEADKQGFYDRVRAAREAGKPAEIVTQPVPERIKLQIEQEMATGKAQVARNAAQKSIPAVATFVDKTEGFMTPVHRPGDYVPDQKKGQGNVTNTIL